jgi:hypothetical protein
MQDIYLIIFVHLPQVFKFLLIIRNAIVSMFGLRGPTTDEINGNYILTTLLRLPRKMLILRVVLPRRGLYAQSDRLTAPARTYSRVCVSAQPSDLEMTGKPYWRPMVTSSSPAASISIANSSKSPLVISVVWRISQRTV